MYVGVSHPKVTLLVVTPFIMMAKNTDSVTYEALYRLMPDVRYETQEREKERNI